MIFQYFCGQYRLKSVRGFQMTTRHVVTPSQSEMPPKPPKVITTKTIPLDAAQVDCAANRLAGCALPQKQKTIALVLIDTNTVFTVSVADRILIGRGDIESNNKPDVDLMMHSGREKGVSRSHAALYRDDSLFSIMDLNSTNGTYLNGVRLLPDHHHYLRDGDEICLGKMLFHIHFVY
jgi:hypothetical protein